MRTDEEEEKEWKLGLKSLQSLIYFTLSVQKIASSERNRALEHFKMVLGARACPLLLRTDAPGKRRLRGAQLGSQRWMP